MEMIADSKINKTRGGDIIVDDVVVPHHVIDELHKNGLSVCNFHAGELKDIIAACSVDGRLIDDVGDAFWKNLHDRMLLTDAERVKHRISKDNEGCDPDDEPHSFASKCRKKSGGSYCAQIKEEKAMHDKHLHVHN